MSLLLDALRQAEKNKSKQKNENGSEEINKGSSFRESVDDSKDKDEILIELEVLPEFDLSLDEHSFIEPSSEEDLANENIDELLETKISELELQAQTDGHASESNEQSFLLKKVVEENGNDETIPEVLAVDQGIQSEDIPSLAEEETDTTVEYQTDAEINVETETDISSAEPKLRTAVKEKDAEIGELDADVINVLQTTEKGGMKTIYWLAFLFLIAVLCIAAYLYSLTLPNTVQANSDEAPIDILIDDPLLAENTDVNSSINVEGGYQKESAKQETQKPTPALAVMARPESNISEVRANDKAIPEKESSVALNTRPTSSEFFVEDEEGIDYPKKITIKIKRQQPTLVRNLVEAYSAYQRQDYFSSEALYKKILLQDIINIDALLGLGAIAEQLGESQRAQLLYEKVLILNGNNVNANNALIRLKNSRYPAENESRYKTVIEKFPDNANAYAELGNIYLSKQQWHKAQEAYFNAVERSPDSAHYHFNLAVSLDHLSKKAAAIQYYQKAMQLNNKDQAVFDDLAVEQRIQQLQGQE